MVVLGKLNYLVPHSQEGGVRLSAADNGKQRNPLLIINGHRLMVQSWLDIGLGIKRLPSKGMACLIAGLSLASSASAQQGAQYLFAPFTLVEANPAAAGMDDHLVFSAGLRRQWNALPGQPEGYHVSGHIGLPFLSSGVGASLLRDQVGLYRFTELLGHFNYQLLTGRATQLSGGLSLGWMQAGLDGSGIRTPGGQYPVDGGLDHQDDLLPERLQRGGMPLLHLGVMFRSRTMEGGLSLRHLQGSLEDRQAREGELAFQPHVYGHLSYRAGAGSLLWQPVLQGRTDGLEWQAEGMLLLHWKERFMLGGGLRGATSRQRDAWLLSAGLRISERFLLLYAFEQGISPLRTVQQGSFELMIRYDLEVRTGRGILPPRIHNPRFL